MALHFLAADVEDADQRLGAAEDGAREDVAQRGKLHEVVGIAFNIGAEVEHHALAAQGREKAGDGRPMDARQRAQHELGDGQQCAGVARRHDASSLSALHSLAGQMHA
jgi:hypothetical protein